MTTGSPTDPQATILLVDDIPTNLEVLVDLFLDQGMEVVVATDGPSALQKLEYATPDVILLDVMMPGMDGFETCGHIRARPETADVPILFMTALSEVSAKVTGFSLGAVDYVTKPFQVEEVVARVGTHLRLRRLQAQLEAANAHLEARVAERTAALEDALAELQRLKDKLEQENVYLQQELARTHDFETIVGESPAIKRTLRQVERVAPTDATVLILGETGTGKEVFARAIHEHSGRAGRALVKLNCAALPAQLVESELFGHEKGSFTGAVGQRIGRFELADGGTLFLDEVGELPLDLQAKLLRVLQEGELERIGSGKTIHVDVRVVAATNRDLESAVAQGTFREDLYYRLNVFPIHLPPVRERRGDVPLLVRHFLTRLTRKIGRQIDRVPQAVMDRLEQHRWPGNVRELAHVLERAVILSAGPELSLDDWTPRGGGGGSGGGGGAAAEAGALATLQEQERAHILRALKLTGGRVSGAQGAAKLLDINPKTLESRMKRLGIERSRDFS